jgi:hypothetical protein
MAAKLLARFMIMFLHCFSGDSLGHAGTAVGRPPYPPTLSRCEACSTQGL